MSVAPPLRFHGHPAHPPPVWRHNQPIILFVSVRLARPEMVNLACRPICEAMERAWRRAVHWRTGSYLVMPDHVHFFCAPGVPDYPPVRRWLGFWKRLLGSEVAGLKSAFLPDCWDTQMRDREHYLEKLDYLHRNPERKGLVRPDEPWPFQGTVFPLTGW